MQKTDKKYSRAVEKLLRERDLQNSSFSLSKKQSTALKRACKCLCKKEILITKGLFNLAEKGKMKPTHSKLKVYPNKK